MCTLVLHPFSSEFGIVSPDSIALNIFKCPKNGIMVDLFATCLFFSTGYNL